MAEERVDKRTDERSVWREYIEALIIAAVFLLFTNTFVVQTFYIPSGSMEDTLLIGDHLFVNRFIYGPTPTGAEKRAAAVPPGAPRRHRGLPLAREPGRSTSSSAAWRWAATRSR